MTCREKLKIEHPDKVNDKWIGGCCSCPSTYGYLDDPINCSGGGDLTVCTRCWDREFCDAQDVRNDIDELYSRLMFSGFTEEQTRIILEGFHIIINYLEKKEG